MSARHPPISTAERKALRLIDIHPARRITGGYLTRGTRISKATASKLTAQKLAYHNSYTPATALRITKLGQSAITK